MTCCYYLLFTSYNSLLFAMFSVPSVVIIAS
jgi:hypothetical protein